MYYLIIYNYLYIHLLGVQYKDVVRQNARFNGENLWGFCFYITEEVLLYEYLWI